MTNYVYDAANRLTSVNGQAYTWDDNGNLVNDGVNIYAFNQANRLISTTDGIYVTEFKYNGEGARLERVVNPVDPNRFYLEDDIYFQDLAAPLPVVLQMNHHDMFTWVLFDYLYGLGTRPFANYHYWQPGPIALEYREYLLADALGSVRQIVDANGNVTLAESYEPYGTVLTSTGTASSIFGYAGEQVDTYIKLVFLRSRYYSPETARFLSKDVWQGDYTRPQSFNAWMYVEGNPITRVDPTGLMWSCYPKNDGCAQWIFSALDKIEAGGALSQEFLNLLSQKDIRYWFVINSDNTGIAPPIPQYDHVFLTSSYLSEPLPPSNFHTGVFVHETVHAFRSPVERTTIFSEVEAFVVEAGILQEIGAAGEVLPFMKDLINVAVEGGQVTRDLDKLAKARCILLRPESTGGNSFTEMIYYNEALIFNYNQGWWEPCRACGKP